MKALKSLAGIAVALSLLSPQAVVGESITIGTSIFPGGLPNGNEIFLEYWDQNEVDDHAKKRLTFEGVAVTGANPPVVLELMFDWRRTPTGDPEYSEPGKFMFTVYPSPAETPIFATLVIPFCPPEVSIHFRIVPDDQGQIPGGVAIFGTFTHECLNNVPDVLSGFEWIGVLGLLAGYRRITNRAACNA